MTTALNIIERALLDLTVLGEGDVATSRQASDGLVYLNDLIQAWDNEGLMVNSVTTDSLTMTGATSYTFGTGGTFNAARPVSALSAYFTYDGFDYPIDITTREQYEAVADKTATSDMPDRIYINYTYPLATVYVYPVPSTGTLKVATLKPITELAASGTVLAMPPGYERALRLSLAVEMMPMYGLQNQLIMTMAEKAKRDIQKVNSANMPKRTGLGLPAGYRQTGNILTG